VTLYTQASERGMPMTDPDGAAMDLLGDLAYEAQARAFLLGLAVAFEVQGSFTSGGGR